MQAPDAAQKRYRVQARLTVSAASDAKRRWGTVDPNRIAASWARQVPSVTVSVTGAQYANAAAADAYTQSVMAETGQPHAAEYGVVAAALAGTAADGRPLPSLLFQPAADTLSAIKDGVPVGKALAAGYAQLDMFVRTEVADAGRTADQISATTHGAQGYVRMVVGKTCNRCIILAGRWYPYSTGFQRHPNCDCIMVPAREDEQPLTHPQAIYDDLSPAERSAAGWSKAEQQAIADGADIAAVTNIHRSGLYVAGGKQYTREAAGSRRKRRPRITPRQIYIEAAGDRNEAIRLLRLHNYLR